MDARVPVSTLLINRPVARLVRGLFASGVAFACVVAAVAWAGTPRIDHIERVLRDETVTVHFGAEPNRTYELQYLATLTCPLSNAAVRCNSSGVPTNIWVTFFLAPSLPFTNHYIVRDYRTNASRFYRLRVKP